MMRQPRYASYKVFGALAALVTLFVFGCDTSPVPMNDVDETLLEECPEFAATYTTCDKLGGIQPQFFQSVEIETHAHGFHFTTATEQGPIVTEYLPDLTVRLGSDYHMLDDGTLLPDLPSLESSSCDAGELIRREFTILPDQTLAQEQNTMWIGDDGELLYQISVNGQIQLEARCFE